MWRVCCGGAIGGRRRLTRPNLTLICPLCLSGMESNFSLLDVAGVMKGYRSAKRRVIFLDYGGTICTTPKRSIAYYAHANKVGESLPVGLSALSLLFRFRSRLVEPAFSWRRTVGCSWVVLTLWPSCLVAGIFAAEFRCLACFPCGHHVVLSSNGQMRGTPSLSLTSPSHFPLSLSIYIYLPPSPSRISRSRFVVSVSAERCGQAPGRVEEAPHCPLRRPQKPGVCYQRQGEGRAAESPGRHQGRRGCQLCAVIPLFV